jgi:Fe-S-cluster containining protein
VAQADELDDLMVALMEDERFASGARRFPRAVSGDQAVGIARLLHDEVDRGTQAREEAAAAQGITIACGRGCRRCCAEPLLVYHHEALAIAGWLEEPAQAAVKAAFLAAYPAWRAAMGDAPERLADLVAGAASQATYDAAHAAQTRRGILCAFNDADGACTIHPVRPVACRNGHAVETSDYCGADHPSGKSATRLQFVPLDRFLATIRRLDRALHHALGGARGRPESICVAVHRLLTSTAPPPR